MAGITVTKLLLTLYCQQRVPVAAGYGGHQVRMRLLQLHRPRHSRFLVLPAQASPGSFPPCAHLAVCRGIYTPAAHRAHQQTGLPSPQYRPGLSPKPALATAGTPGKKARACCSPGHRGFSLTCSDGHSEGIPTSHHGDLHCLEPHNQVGYAAVAGGAGAQLPVLVAPKGVTLARS